MEVCRICGGTEVLKCFLGNNQLLELLRVCANIEVKENDILPKHICEQCEFGLRFSYRLRKQSEETEKRLRQEVMQADHISTTTTDNQDLASFDNSKPMQVAEIATPFITTTLTQEVDKTSTSTYREGYQIAVTEQSAQVRQVSTSTIEIRDQQQVQVVREEKLQQISERFRLELKERGVEMSTVMKDILNESEGFSQQVIAEKRIRLDMDEDFANDYSTYEDMFNEDGDNDDIIELVDDEPIIEDPPFPEQPYEGDLNTNEYQAQDIIEEILLSDDDDEIQTNSKNMNGTNEGRYHEECNTDVVYEGNDDECEDSLGAEDCQIYFTKEEQNYIEEGDENAANESIKSQNNKTKQDDAESALEENELAFDKTDENKLNGQISTSENKMQGKISAYTCPTCDLGMATQHEYREHIKIHGNKRFCCPECGRWFPKRYRLEMHAKTHQTDGQRLQCPHCERTYQLQSNLTRHIRNFHQEKAYMCSVCGEKFGRSDNLKNHMFKHTDVQEFQCEQCPERFKCKQYLAKHMRKHDKESKTTSDEDQKDDDNKNDDNGNQSESEKMYFCSYCGKKSKHQFTHKMHLRIHTQERPHKCDACGKAFRTLAALITHERIHDNARPYQCEHCLLSFRQQAHLKEHRMIHEGITPHICSICKLSFTKKNNMLVHMRIHSGENPYKCMICGEQFKKPMQLQKHENTVHNKVLEENENINESTAKGGKEDGSFNLNGEEEDEDADAVEGEEEDDEVEGAQFANEHESDMHFSDLTTKLLCSDSNSIEVIESEASISGNITTDEIVMHNGTALMSGMVANFGLVQSFSNDLSGDFHVDNNDVVLVVDDNAKFNSLFILDD